jgi:hypothetical protein
MIGKNSEEMEKVDGLPGDLWRSKGFQARWSQAIQLAGACEQLAQTV